MSDLTAIKNNEILKLFFDRTPKLDLKTFNVFDKWEGLEQEQISDRPKTHQQLKGMGVGSQKAIGKVNEHGEKQLEKKSDLVLTNSGKKVRLRKR